MSDLWAALCLALVLEGLMLFALPGFWKRNAAEMLKMPDRQLRMIGGGVMAAALVVLYLLRSP
ncbi:DUF2065 family protein [Luteimonas sp. Y-2-2-4F]|nr:DUF2065 family protein [Luteimonas sp. Y-2-2-4F]MCD9032564.1 DUF2065 family protein [Luteimonas sp. Y-2-2-4F]